MSHRFCWSSDPHPNKYVILRGKWEWSTITISWNSILNDHQPLIWMTTNDRTSTSGYFQYYTHSPTELVEEKTWSENKVGYWSAPAFDEFEPGKSQKSLIGRWRSAWILLLLRSTAPTNCSNHSTEYQTMLSIKEWDIKTYEILKSKFLECKTFHFKTRGGCPMIPSGWLLDVDNYSQWPLYVPLSPSLSLPPCMFYVMRVQVQVVSRL